MSGLWRKWDVEIISALLCLLAGLMLYGASGCDSDDDGDAWPPWPTWGEAGTVYACEADCGGMSGEWCWNGSEEELEALLGDECHPITITERAWPALTGCRYACPAEGRGANAHCGEACP